MDHAPASPFRLGASIEEQLAYYKAQYEQLEIELQEFQASSRELEAELEKDVEASEKRERKLKEQTESLGFQVEEWKTKHKQAKSEANTAQISLQKEITTIRDSHRTLQLKLRDIEVANDDYERQARNTTSSLEDLESKYNVAIERAVMLEEEIRSGDQEREALRIETQRLRDELSDLRVESEITTEKLRLADANIESLHSRKPMPTFLKPIGPRTPTSEASTTEPPSPSISTPPQAKSVASGGTHATTPPSPPLSDAPANPAVAGKTPALAKRRSLLPDPKLNPRSRTISSRAPRHSRGPSLAASAVAASSGSHKMGPPPPRPAASAPENLPRSGSLYQIKGLIGRMQKIEERVHSVRSRLPPPSNTTPKGSPRSGSGLNTPIPTTITVRSGRKRPSNMHLSPAKPEGESVESESTLQHDRRMSFGVTPLSFADRPGSSHSRPASRASNVGHGGAERPESRASMREASSFARPQSRASMGGAGSFTRPESRASMGGAGAYARPESRTGMNVPSLYARPESRTSTTGPPPSLGHFASHTIASDRRPRSSMTGNYASLHATNRHVHSRSASVTEVEEPEMPVTPSARRTTIDKSSIPTPGTAARRQSGQVVSHGGTVGRRTSTNFTSPAKGMASTTPRRPRVSGVGETF